MHARARASFMPVCASLLMSRQCTSPRDMEESGVFNSVSRRFSRHACAALWTISDPPPGRWCGLQPGSTSHLGILLAPEWRGRCCRGEVHPSSADLWVVQRCVPCMHHLPGYETATPQLVGSGSQQLPRHRASCQCRAVARQFVS